MGNLEIYVGINGTGKSTELKNKFTEKEKVDSAIFIDSEFLNSEEYKGVKNGTTLSNLFINKILNYDYKSKNIKDINDQIKNLKDNIEIVKKEIIEDFKNYFEGINRINSSNFNKDLILNNEKITNEDVILSFFTNQNKMDDKKIKMN